MLSSDRLRNSVVVSLVTTSRIKVIIEGEETGSEPCPRYI